MKYNTFTVSECGNPEYGFNPTGTKRTEHGWNDRFIFDFSKKRFTWSDRKDTSTYLMTEIQKTGNSYTFWTKHHHVRFTVRSYDYLVEIIFRSNSGWVYLSCECE